MGVSIAIRGNPQDRWMVYFMESPISMDEGYPWSPFRQVEHADQGGRTPRMPLAMCELQKRGDLLHLRLDDHNLLLLLQE